MSDIIQLVYLSTATRPMPPEELTELLRSSRERNRGVGVTGILMYCKHHFLQVLEGPEDAVMTLFEKISKDSRHKDIQVLLRQRAGERDFNEWQMAFRAVSDAEAQEVMGYLPWNAACSTSVEDSRTREMMQYFHDMMSLQRIE